MRYISDDGKVYNTEQECCEHEQMIEKNRMAKEQLELEKQKRLETINEKYNELNKLISEYTNDYCIRRSYFPPVNGLFSVLSIL